MSKISRQSDNRPCVRSSTPRRTMVMLLALLAVSVPCSWLQAEVSYAIEGGGPSSTEPSFVKLTATETLAPATQATEDLTSSIEQFNSPDQALSSLKLFAMVTLLSTAPAMLLMTTSFLRISIVLSLLRQALGTQQNPSNQAIASLALFMSALIMAPTWQTVYQKAIVPYSNQEISGEQAWEISRGSLVTFMGTQIDNTGNTDDVWLFYDYLPKPDELPVTAEPAKPSYLAASQNPVTPTSYHDIPLQALLPAFMTSELKTAFLIGFLVFLPFLVIDLVVSATTNSMGMMMLPPTTVSLPFKLMLFVMVDGWHLLVGTLLESFV
jgi:flagellar biosynthesis protein FliP